MNGSDRKREVYDTLTDTKIYTFSRIVLGRNTSKIAKLCKRYNLALIKNVAFRTEDLISNLTMVSFFLFFLMVVTVPINGIGRFANTGRNMFGSVFRPYCTERCLGKFGTYKTWWGQERRRETPSNLPKKILFLVNRWETGDKSKTTFKDSNFWIG